MKGAPAEYEQNFKDALTVFSHQTVFDINAGESVPLKKLITPPTKEQQLKCGKYLFNDKCTPAFQNIVLYKFFVDKKTNHLVCHMSGWLFSENIIQ